MCKYLNTVKDAISGTSVPKRLLDNTTLHLKCISLYLAPHSQTYLLCHQIPCNVYTNLKHNMPKFHAFDHHIHNNELYTCFAVTNVTACLHKFTW